MRLRKVHIENFRGIELFDVEGLQDLVVIAGPNGCGKTAVLDGIRLLKSVYGGYSINEWQSWFGEFQINISQPYELLRLLRDRSKELVIKAEIDLSSSERSFLTDHADEILRPLAWQGVLGRNVEYSYIPMATELRQYGAQVDAELAARVQQLVRDLESEAFTIGLSVSREGNFNTDPSPVIETVFQTYRPHDLGVIDYHSSSRVYEREALGAVNLNLDALTQQRRSQLLYNWREKYRNVKTELAANYVLDIIARQSGRSSIGRLNETLAELFQTFFPDKAYDGPAPQPDGSLLFPVRTNSGAQHDVDDLSSGEKELLYGYLRLRNSAPHGSVILLDEPELHLNPRLQQGLLDFYHAHLGQALDNQLWLVTHSDTLLRQAVGNPNYSVYHMSAPVSGSTGGNQVVPVIANDELEQAVVDIVGDLAAYKPRGKVVILEGGGDTEFDVDFVSRLFPAFSHEVNLVPGGAKRRVRDLYDIFSTAASRAGLAERFFAVVDRDRELDRSVLPGNVLSWDRYHIENYLLEPSHLAAACSAVQGRTALADLVILDRLRDCARRLVDRLVLERLQDEINGELMREVKVGAAPDSISPAADLVPSITGSLTRLADIGAKYADGSRLATREQELRATLEDALNTDQWQIEFPGRSILRRFVGEYVTGVSYEAFRNVTIDKMVEAGYKPSGMESVIAAIVNT